MREAVIVSTARTPIGRAYRGAFNDTQAQQLGAHAVKHAVARAGVDPAEIRARPARTWRARSPWPPACPRPFPA